MQICYSFYPFQIVAHQRRHTLAFSEAAISIVHFDNGVIDAILETRKEVEVGEYLLFVFFKHILNSSIKKIKFTPLRIIFKIITIIERERERTILMNRVIAIVNLLNLNTSLKLI